MHQSDPFGLAPRPPHDQNWADVARGARTALDFLGYQVKGACLPGEDDACGGSFAQHCVAYFATIAAVTGRNSPHATEIYNNALIDIRNGCQLEEH